MTALGAIATAAVVYYWVDFPIAARQLGAAEEQARKAGVPLTMEELRQHFRYQPERNSAPVYQRIIDEHEEAIGEVSDGLEDALAEGGGGPEEALRVAARVAAPMTELYRASKLPYYVHELDLDLGYHAPLGPESQALRVTRIFTLRALAYAQLGRAEEAARDLATSRRIAAQLAQGTTVRPAQIASHIHERTLRYTNRAAAALARSPEGLALLEREVLGMEELPLDLRRAMLGEAYSTIALVRNAGVQTRVSPATGLMDIWSINELDTGLSMLWHFFDGGNKRQSIYDLDPSKVRRSGKPAGWIAQGTMTRLLEGWTAYFEALPESGATLADLIQAHRSMEQTFCGRRLSYVIVGSKANQIHHFHAAQRRYKAWLGISRAYLDVLQYRNQHGRWPESLAKAGVEALDPFDGEPLRYQVEADGFRVWSVGRNRRDDGGVARAGLFDLSTDDFVASYPPPAIPKPDRTYRDPEAFRRLMGEEPRRSRPR